MAGPHWQWVNWDSSANCSSQCQTHVTRIALVPAVAASHAMHPVQTRIRISVHLSMRMLLPCCAASHSMPSCFQCSQFFSCSQLAVQWDVLVLPSRMSPAHSRASAISTG